MTTLTRQPGNSGTKYGVCKVTWGGKNRNVRGLTAGATCRRSTGPVRTLLSPCFLCRCRYNNGKRPSMVPNLNKHVVALIHLRRMNCAQRRNTTFTVFHCGTVETGTKLFSV